MLVLVVPAGQPVPSVAIAVNVERVASGTAAWAGREDATAGRATRRSAPARRGIVRMGRTVRSTDDGALTERLRRLPAHRCGRSCHRGCVGAVLSGHEC